MAVFRIQSQKTPPPYDVRAPMLDHSDPLGANVNVLNSWLLFLVAATSTHTTGSRQYRAPRSKMAVGNAAVRPRRRCSGFERTGGACVTAPSSLTRAIPHRPSKMCRLLTRSRL